MTSIFGIRVQSFMILPTLLLLIQSGSQARPQHNEEVFVSRPASSIQITKEKVVKLQPKALDLSNITAHTQEILAKIDEVNRQHGYRKNEAPKRSHFVPGYFTHSYNYKEKLLKGFDNYQLNNQEYRDHIDKFKPNQPVNTAIPVTSREENEKMRKLEELQAELSVNHVTKIVQNYPLHKENNHQISYPFGYLNYQQQVLPTIFLPNSIQAPGSVYLFPYPSLDQYKLVPIIYQPYFINYPPQTTRDKLNKNEVKRAPKILDKSKTMSMPNEEIVTTVFPITSNSQSFKDKEVPKHNNKVVIENVDVPLETAESNKTQLLLQTYSEKQTKDDQYIVKPKLRPQQHRQPNSENRRNTKRPSIFRPHTWFNNQPMLQNSAKNKTEANNNDGDIETESVSIETSGESNKGLGFFTHNNRRKIFGKDNTGSGIFIHKLKVRKGGVAIAGPGGIATAGSGGTAIVGPNGYAFTHPDSLAIAGSGTKVIAVDPNINLTDLVNNGTLNAALRARVGKVVATGPVVYYNKG